MCILCKVSLFLLSNADSDSHSTNAFGSKLDTYNQDSLRDESVADFILELTDDYCTSVTGGTASGPTRRTSVIQQPSTVK